MHLLLTLFSLLLTIPFAEDTTRTTFQVIEEGSEEPLPGATVYINELDRGASADAEGLVVFKDLPNGTFTAEVRHVGLEAVHFEFEIPFPGEQPITIPLHHEEAHLDEITVSTTRTTRGIEEIPTRVEALPDEEIEEKINMRPGDIRMLLAESTGIQVQQTSPVSGNANFRIQGLDGRYTQLLKDGFPLYSGFSGGLSIMQIPPLDLHQVEVIKGSSSTLYGGGAIAGLVNLISKQPDDEAELSLLANTSTSRNLDFSGYYSKKFGKVGTNIFGTYNHNPGYDPSDQGFSAIPQHDRFSLNPRLFWEPDSNTKVMAAGQFSFEDRLGGDMSYLNGREGNYFEQHNSRRFTTQFMVNHLFSDRTKLTAKNSLTFFDRSIEVPDHQFQGRQSASFSELSLHHSASTGSWVGGLNLWTDQFDDQTSGETLSRDYNSLIYGAFAQHTYNWTNKLSTETGLRTDLVRPAPEAPKEGLFLLPKVSVHYLFNNHWSVRLGGGLGYKMPDMFTDEAENRAFRNVEKPDLNEVKPEDSKGLNADVNFRTTLLDQIGFTWNQLFFLTRLNDPLVLSADDGDVYHFSNLDGHVTSRGTESNISFIYDPLKLFFGYTFVDANRHVQGTKSQSPLNSPHQVNAILMLEEHGSYRLGFEGYYYSRQKLSDGSTGRGYTIFGIMGEKTWDHITLFANFENIFDTRQTQFGPIYTGSRSQPQFNDIFAPLEGRYINAGVKIAL